MKTLVALLMLACSVVSAQPYQGQKPVFPPGYFHYMDPSNPQISAGALFDPRGDITRTQAVTDIAIVTHSTTDGSIIPASWQSYIPPEAWVPLQIGGGGTGGNYIINVGSSVNFLPIVQAWALKGLNFASPDNYLVGLKNALASQVGSTFSIAAGPAWSCAFIQNGTMLPLDHWMGQFRWYAGAAWKL